MSPYPHRNDLQSKLVDLVTAHWKVLIAVAGILFIQFVPSDTADWIGGLLTALGVYGKSNNQDAKRRLGYRRR